MTIDGALGVFVGGFTFTRSVTFAYLSERIAPGVWRLFDAPRKRDADYRGEEFVANSASIDAEALDKLARARSRGRYKICALIAEEGPDTALRTEFKRLRYRLMATEPLMARDLRQNAPLPAVSGDCPAKLVRVTSADEAQLLAKAALRRQILPEHLVGDSPIRQYMALSAGGVPIGWVGSVAVRGEFGDDAWVTNLFVAPEHRRQGIARNLLLTMLADDCAAGARTSVLLASHTGAHLYPTVGYRQLGTLYIYTPPRTVTG